MCLKYNIFKQQHTFTYETFCQYGDVSVTSISSKAACLHPYSQIYKSRSLVVF